MFSSSSNTNNDTARLSREECLLLFRKIVTPIPAFKESKDAEANQGGYTKVSWNREIKTGGNHSSPDSDGSGIIQNTSSEVGRIFNGVGYQGQWRRWRVAVGGRGRCVVLGRRRVWRWRRDGMTCPAAATTWLPAPARRLGSTVPAAVSRETAPRWRRQPLVDWRCRGGRKAPAGLAQRGTQARIAAFAAASVWPTDGERRSVATRERRSAAIF